MAKLQDQCKLCRREGEKLYLKGERCFTTKCALIKRNYKPGVHGPSGGGMKLTDYGKQLRAKQAAKRLYGLSEKQFSNYVAKAMRKKDNTSDMIVVLLESRLDNVIYKSGIAVSRKLARQMVGHGFFYINSKKVDIPSYQIKPGDVITINPTKVNKKVINEIKERIKNKEVPNWMNLEKTALEIKMTSLPQMEKGEKLFDIQSVVEFYSR